MHKIWTGWRSLNKAQLQKGTVVKKKKKKKKKLSQLDLQQSLK